MNFRNATANTKSNTKFEPHNKKDLFSMYSSTEDLASVTSSAIADTKSNTKCAPHNKKDLFSLFSSTEGLASVTSSASLSSITLVDVIRHEVSEIMSERNFRQEMAQELLRQHKSLPSPLEPQSQLDTREPTDIREQSKYIKLDDLKEVVAKLIPRDIATPDHKTKCAEMISRMKKENQKQERARNQLLLRLEQQVEYLSERIQLLEESTTCKQEASIQHDVQRELQQMANSAMAAAFRAGSVDGDHAMDIDDEQPPTSKKVEKRRNYEDIARRTAVIAANPISRQSRGAPDCATQHAARSISSPTSVTVPPENRRPATLRELLQSHSPQLPTNNQNQPRSPQEDEGTREQ